MWSLTVFLRIYSINCFCWDSGVSSFGSTIEQNKNRFHVCISNSIHWFISKIINWSPALLGYTTKLRLKRWSVGWRRATVTAKTQNVVTHSIFFFSHSYTRNKADNMANQLQYSFCLQCLFWHCAKVISVHVFKCASGMA